MPTFVILSPPERRRTRYKYVLDLPVVDLDGVFPGAVTYEDIAETTQKDATADLQTMVGASKEERALSEPRTRSFPSPVQQPADRSPSNDQHVVQRAGANTACRRGAGFCRSGRLGPD